MTPDRWRQVDRLLEEALERPAAERAAFLSAACRGDAELREEVESLLAACDGAGSFMERPPVEAMDQALDEPPAPSLVGRTLGHYRLTSLLGRGGMGEVYRAVDEHLDRAVAVKILPAHLAHHADARARFEREAKAVAALSHPNILAIHDFATEQGIYYAVMELLEGETLRDLINRGVVGWRRAAEVGAAVADGLAAAHARGIIHRDLKPENIFLCADGQVKILDFGIARVKQTPAPAASAAARPQTTAPGVVLGTVGYMSPEQVRGEKAEAQSDLFALGCVLHEMVAGERPFARATMTETMAAILRDDPPPLPAGQLPAEFERAIRHCLEKRPRERLQSAHDLAIELRAMASESQRLRARAASRWRRAAWYSAALAGLLLAVSALLYFPAWREEPIDSLAVLPLTNASTDANAEYLSDGLTESLINSLAQLPRLRVMARSTVFRYKGREVDPRAVGRELKVSAVLVGRVTGRDDTLHIAIEVVRVADGARLWGGQYSRRLADLIQVQEEMQRHISENLRLTLTGADRRRLAKHYTENTAAYQLYLRGRYAWNRRTPDKLREAISYFQQAIETDPLYALAYSGLADSYFLLGPLGVGVLPAEEAVTKQRAAATRALELDDSLAEAHTSLAVVKMVHEWDWAGAEQSFRRAIELNPSYATARSWHAALLTTTGRAAEGVEEIKRALELDPFSIGISNALAGIYAQAGRLDESVAQFRQTIEMNPNHFVPHADLAQIHAQQGRYAEAVAELNLALKLSERSPDVLATLAHVHAAAGRRAAAQELLAELLARRAEASPFDIALVYAGLGEKDQAFAWLETAYRQRSPSLVYLKSDRRLSSLHSDPRFADLLRRIRLS